MPEQNIKVSGQQVMNALQFNRQKMDSLNARNGELRALHQELNFARDSLNELKGTKEQSILVNLGGGNFIEAVPDSTLTVKHGIAGNVVKDSTAAEALKDIEKRLKEAEGELQVVAKDLNTTGKTVKNLLSIMKEAEKQRQ